MTTQTTIVGTPTLPRVNLLPPEIAEARTLKQYRLGAAGAVALAFVAVGGLYMNAHSGVAGAQSALDASTAKTAQLTSQQKLLTQQTSIKDTVASAQATLATALSPEILWSHYLQDMSVALAGNYWFTSLAMSSGGGTAAAGATASPTSDPSAIGAIVIQGRAVTHNDVSALLVALANEKGLSHPVFTSSAEDASPVTGTRTRLVTFSAGVSVDSPQTPKVAATVTPTTATTNAATPTTTTPAGH